VHAGVLNNSWQTPEGNKVVRQVTEVFLHEEFDFYTYLNDIAILKVGICLEWDKQIFYTFAHKKPSYKEITIETNSLHEAEPFLRSHQSLSYSRNSQQFMEP
jgi:hypothetical protein